MARVFEREMGVEKEVLKSYDGWDNVGDAGVVFHSCDFKILSGLTRYDGCSLLLAYDRGEYEILEYGEVIHTGKFSLSFSRF